MTKSKSTETVSIASEDVGKLQEVALAPQRDTIHALLIDLAESEHRHRHPQAFADLMKMAGFEISYDKARMTVKPVG